MKPVIDSHIHLDLYDRNEREQILRELPLYQVDSLLAVSFHLSSCLQTLSYKHPSIKHALGYHPEQALPETKELEAITELIRNNRSTIVAIGEVGLPYYTDHGDMKNYAALLEHFIKLAKELQKPVILHAIYEGADIACDLLEKHEVTDAHFHWFKGSEQTLDRMKKKGYRISVTPDCVYEQEIQSIIEHYPIELLMVETDGPWQFEGKYEGQLTHPKMIHDSIATIAQIKHLPIDRVYEIMYKNTKHFYKLDAPEKGNR
ncbi:TatD family hydrolase [Halobacillus litoralis]|uniref:TatD family hydrolase n=1 Tax=Halobacillus litoralis TaxID=45668 RepID=UPI001CD2BE9B|nr:TatD family hydrolase [Halobacillus litoralis]MCA0972012.1 TatD family hydrolase [Halobacillus litoralis]